MSFKTGKQKLYQSGLDKLIQWADSKNFDIIFGNNYIDEMTHYDRTITINTRSKLENQLYACLHECGHLLIHLNKNYKKKYPNSYKIESLPTKHKGLIRAHKYQVDVIAEEIDAWRKGKELAKRLNIKINENNYNDEMSKYVFTYIKSAGKK